MLWRLPVAVLASGQDERVLEAMIDQVRDADGFLHRVRELYGDVEASSFDLIECTDGRLFERYSQPQRIGGEVVGRVWSFRDITERRRAEQQNRLLAQTIQSTGDIVGITDLEGRFTFVNRAFLNTYGYDEADVLGRTTALIDSPRNRPGLQAEIREATRRGPQPFAPRHTSGWMLRDNSNPAACATFSRRKYSSRHCGGTLARK